MIYIGKYLNVVYLRDHSLDIAGLTVTKYWHLNIKYQKRRNLRNIFLQLRDRITSSECFFKPKSFRMGMGVLAFVTLMCFLFSFNIEEGWGSELS